jgi:8-amino-7-oxononanoate synthase
MAEPLDAPQWQRWLTGELASIRESGRWRAVREFAARGPEGVLDGRPTVSYASNDYLGLAFHPAVADAAAAAARTLGTGATASRLVVGTGPAHVALERSLAAWKGSEGAVVLPSGYAANLAVLTVLGGSDVTVLSDELNHASIIDGCRLSRSRLVVYPHRDLDAVRDGLRAATTERTLVVSDAVFSMDGDAADVDALAALCAEYGALLVIDEAHAVLGPHLDGRWRHGVVRVGTLSKTLGALGGFVCATRDVVDLLVNRGRPFIFTTGLSPTDAAAASAALAVLRSVEGDALVTRLRTNVDRVRPGHPSPIIPVVIGAEDDTVAVSARLAERGILIPAIRPPTVAPGTSRLRVALSALHTEAMIDDLMAALDDLLTEGWRGAA